MVRAIEKKSALGRNALGVKHLEHACVDADGRARRACKHARTRARTHVRACVRTHGANTFTHATQRSATQRNATQRNKRRPSDLSQVPASSQSHLGHGGALRNGEANRLAVHAHAELAVQRAEGRDAPLAAGAHVDTRWARAARRWKALAPAGGHFEEPVRRHRATDRSSAMPI